MSPIPQKSCDQTADTGVVPVADAMLTAFGELSYVKSITKRDRENLEALAELVIAKLKRIPVGP